MWRHHWDETSNTQYQDLLVTYNQEDCLALKVLVDELTSIKESAQTLSQVDFADQPKRQATPPGEQVHSQFETILKFAHTNYDKKKIESLLRRSRNRVRKRAIMDREKYNPKPQRSPMCRQVKCALIMTNPFDRLSGCLKDSLLILSSPKTGFEKRSLSMWESRDTVPRVKDTMYPPKSGNMAQTSYMGMDFRPGSSTNALLYV